MNVTLGHSCTSTLVPGSLVHDYIVAEVLADTVSFWSLLKTFLELERMFFFWLLFYFPLVPGDYVTPVWGLMTFGDVVSIVDYFVLPCHHIYVLMCCKYLNLLCSLYTFSSLHHPPKLKYYPHITYIYKQKWNKKQKMANSARYEALIWDSRFSWSIMKKGDKRGK